MMSAFVTYQFRRLRQLESVELKLRQSGARIRRGDAVKPEWLLWLLGFSHLREIERLEIGTANCFMRVNPIDNRKIEIDSANDDLLQLISGLQHIKELHLHGSRMSDNGLQHLSKMNSMEKLFLASPNITDKGLANIRNLGNLKFLELKGTKVTAKRVCDLQREIEGLRVEVEQAWIGDWIVIPDDNKGTPNEKDRFQKEGYESQERDPFS